MLILVITDSYFFSGSQNIVMNLIKSKRLNQVHRMKVVIPKSETYERQFKKRMSHSRVDYIAILMPACSHLKQHCSMKGIPTALKSIVYSAARVFQGVYLFLIYDCARTWLLIRKHKPDALYINNSGYPASDFCRAAALSASICSVPFFFHINNISPSMNQTRWLKRPFERWIDRVIGKHVTKFITGSKYAANQLYERRGFPKERICSIYNTYTDRKPTAGREELRQQSGLGAHTMVFGIVGIFHPRKGHKILIDAVSQLHQGKERGALFLVEGPLDHARELMDYAREKNVTGEVVFVGAWDSIFNFYRMIDVLVLPSLCDEDFPNVIVESMSLGIPTVSTRIAGIPEAIEDGYNGYLVEPGNSRQLSRVLATIIEKPHVVASLGLNCLKVFNDKFDYSTIIGQYLELFETRESEQ